MGESLDGQQTPLVPESVVIGVPCSNGSCGRNEEGSNQNLLCVARSESSTLCLDEQGTGDEVDTNPC